MAKSFLLGQKATLLDSTREGSHTGTIVRTFVAGDALKLCIQLDDSGKLAIANTWEVQVLEQPKTN